MALNRNATNGVINGWKNSHFNEQANWRAQRSGKGYFQVLEDRTTKPTDQPEDVPHGLPANPNVEAKIDVYESTEGFGWVATFFADDAGTRWSRTVSSHMDGPLVETDWAEVVEVS